MHMKNCFPNAGKIKGKRHSQLRHYRQLHVESKVIKSLVSVKYVSFEVYQIINLQNYAPLVQKLDCESLPFNN